MTFCKWFPMSLTTPRPIAFGKTLAVAGFLLLACPLQLSASAAAAETQSSAEPAQSVVARVNGQPIFADQIAPAVEQDIRKYRKFGVQNPSEQYVLSIKAKVLEEFIATELLYQAGEKLDVTDLSERIAKQVEALKGSHRQSLAGKSDEELQEVARRQVLIGEYMSRNDLLDPQVPEEQIREYYENNKANFMANETVNVRHILIAAAPDAPAEDRHTALEKIQNARREIMDGKPFEEVAIEVSDCNSASGGDNLGYLERGYMPKEFDEVAFGQEPGVVSQPVETQHGYHLVEVLDHQPAGIRPYEELRDFVGKFLKEEVTQKKLATHLQKLREQAKVEILLN